MQIPHDHVAAMAILDVEIGSSPCPRILARQVEAVYSESIMVADLMKKGSRYRTQSSDGRRLDWRQDANS
jgi:hypothetical protein